MLKRLKKDYKIALVTDGLAAVQKRKVKALKIKDFFDCMMYTDDFKKPKPSPFAFKKIASLFKVPLKNMIYIADDPNKDFIGARRLGMVTLRVKQGRFSDLELGKSYQADYEMNTILETEKLLRSIDF